MGRHTVWIWCAVTLSVSGAFARQALQNLANFRPVSNDEAELIEVGHQLATRGVLGSDMYAGFFSADTHHLWTLPLQHVVDAGVFLAFGTSVLSARSVSVAAATIAIAVVGWLAYRWYGLLAAIACELLLTCWASDLTAAQTTLPLLGVARAARYDVLAVVLCWLTIALLDWQVRCPTISWWRGVLLGVCGGLAALAQFYACAVVAVVVIGSILIRGRQAARALAWSGVGTAVVLAPWAAYVGVYRDDFAGQMSVYGARGDFLQPLFYARNVLSEPLRYTHMFSADDGHASVWILTIAVLPAAAWSAWRARSKEAVGDRLLVTSAVLFGGLLLVFDATKSPVYAIALLPPICLVVSGAWSHAVRWSVQRGYGASAAMLLLSVAVAAPLAIDSRAAWRLDAAESGEVSSYLDVGQQIDAALDPGAAVLGPERWWWPLHSRTYRSLRAVWFRWTAMQPDANLRQLLLEKAPADMIVNDNVRNDIRAFPDALQQQFWTFVDQCTTLAEVIDDRTYMRIEIFRITDLLPVGCRDP